MPCNEWRDEWVAHLYGELSAGERASIDEHLASCLPCSETMQGLANSRRLFAENVPNVPVAPRVLVLRPSGRWSPAWAFAAGLAAATLVFFIGTLAAPEITRTETAAVDFAGLVQGLDQRVSELEEAPAVIQAQPAMEGVVTQEQFDREIDLVARRLRRQRAEDLDYLARWLAASEQRTGTFMNRTEEALTFLALRGDPGASER